MARSSSAPLILGISQPNHNGAACLLRGDEVVVAVQEERLNRSKRSTICNDVDSLAARYCLDYADVGIGDLDLVVLCTMHDQPVRPSFHHPPLVNLSHHLGHAIGVFATSGFTEAAVLVVDGCGSPIAELPEAERGIVKPCRYPPTCAGTAREVVSIYRASGTLCTPLEKHAGFVMDFSQIRRMPDFGSLGGIFNAAAQQIFGNITDAGKVMGLAPYGRPVLRPDDLLRVNENGCFEFYDAIPKRFTHNERWPMHQEAYEDLAHCVQAALENGLRFLIERTRELAPCTNLCYAGGVALNGVANEKIIYRAGYDRVYIMPAAEDSGGAIGAAYHGLWTLTGEYTERRLVRDALGRHYPGAEIAAAVTAAPGVAAAVAPDDLLEAVVDALVAGEIVGWFQGGSELGPRALGQRSILCDPRRPDAKAHLNEHVKHREAFRPFALAILVEEAKRWIDTDDPNFESPFMLRVCRFRNGLDARVPGVSHVDGSGRVQTLSRSADGIFYELVERFHARTGVPMLLNTSLNVMGEPIVESPEDALWCLVYTGVDLLVLGETIVRKRPGLRSVLDLVPRRTITGVDAGDETGTGHHPEFATSGVQRVEVRSANRWGVLSTMLEGTPLAVLDAIDGRSTGREILQALAPVPGIGERELVAALGQLRRASCITFTESPHLR